MAEVTGLRNNALPYPVYGVPWGVVFPMLDADGDLVTGATTPDAEVSKNGDTFADCTNESTEIATSSGIYYLLLTGTEMTADVVAVIAKSATAGMKTTPIVLYPAKLPQLRSGTVGANAADGSTLQLDSNASAVDDYYNGCLLVGTLDSTVEARIITDYAGSTKVCTVTPNFVTAPDNNDTFIIYNPWGREVVKADVVAFNAVAATSSSGRPEVNTTHIAGSSVSTSSAQIGVNVVNAGGTAWNSGAIGAATLAADTITAAKIAADAIGASELAADAVAEIADAVWDEDATGHQTGGTFGQAIGDPGADTNTIYAAVVTNATGATIAHDIVTIDGIVDDILLDTAEIGAAGAGLTNINLPDQTMNITGNITGNLSGSVGSVTGNVGGNVTGSVGSVAAGGIAAASFAANAIDSSALAASAVNEIADQVWEEAIVDHSGTVGSTAEQLAAAGAAGDPWATALPGAYGAGSAGKIIGDNINATISSRATQTSVDTIDDFVDTEVAAIKAKTDQLTFTVANQVDVNIESVNGTTVNGSGTAGDPWGP